MAENSLPAVEKVDTELSISKVSFVPAGILLVLALALNGAEIAVCPARNNDNIIVKILPYFILILFNICSKRSDFKLFICKLS